MPSRPPCSWLRFTALAALFALLPAGASLAASERLAAASGDRTSWWGGADSDSADSDSADSDSRRGKDLRFLAPETGLLTTPGPLAVAVRLPKKAAPDTLRLRVDGAPVTTPSVMVVGRTVRLVVEGLAPGRHELEAEVDVRKGRRTRTRTVSTWVEVAEIDRPDVCETLNGIDCLLPYPSSRFLTPADTPTGYRLDFPAEGMPDIVLGSVISVLTGDRFPLSPDPYRQLDGFSPTVQILMHFPGGVDLVASDAPRLLPETRNFDLRSLDRDSPFVLIDAKTGKRVAHFVENDARAEGSPRQLTILRPAESLVPGRRYIVAVRDIVHPGGTPVEAEPVFAALRDGRPSAVPELEARRAHFEEIFHVLRRAKVKRRDLVLAFDFVTQSDEGLAGQMLSMREQAFGWLAAHDGGRTTFTVDSVDVVNPDCADPDQPVWKTVRGTYQVPLFLQEDPFLFPSVLSPLRTDGAGNPVYETTTGAPYGIAIPCSAFHGDPAPGLVVGHGLFGTGPGTVSGLATGVGSLLEDLKARGLVSPGLRFDYVAGGTNWAGLSGLEAPTDPTDLGALARSFIGQLFLDFDQFEALPDRLRQGQLDALVLARMLATGAFNAHPEFQAPGGTGVIDTEEETYYFGASLGGIMGLMFAALTPDVERLNVDVPAINFSFLLQRAKPFKGFQQFLDVIEPDPLVQLVGVQLLHELWVRGESAGYATHITRKPFPETNKKRILMTVALFDQQVAPLGAQIAAATLGLPNLEGSVVQDLPLLKDKRDPRKSAHIVYDTGSYDPDNPAHAPFIRPLANLTAPQDDNRCDPHGIRALIPASLEQLLTFLQPGGEIWNFCGDDGLCNASEPREIPLGNDAPCDPLE